MDEPKPETAEVTPPQAPSQDTEPKRTEAEKAAFSLKKNAERARELGLDPMKVLGVQPTATIDETLPDDAPLTIGALRELQKQDAHKTALQMAEELPENERDEVKQLLENSIIPSGDAEKDLRLARAAVNAEHNAQIAQMLADRNQPRRTAAGGSQDAPTEAEFTPTPEELATVRGFGFSPERQKQMILQSRKATQK